MACSVTRLTSPSSMFSLAAWTAFCLSTCLKRADEQNVWPKEIVARNGKPACIADAKREVHGWLRIDSIVAYSLGCCRWRAP
jgi:hypothetical protein